MRGSSPAGEERGQKAVAILYDRGRADAPQVVASGRGEVAARIIETARQSGVHILEDADLVELLARVPIGEEIPMELYQAIAEVLAFVYRVNARFRQAGDPPPGDADPG
jgi:flagellar biosynthesis protein